MGPRILIGGGVLGHIIVFFRERFKLLWYHFRSFWKITRKKSLKPLLTVPLQILLLHVAVAFVSIAFEQTLKGEPSPPFSLTLPPPFPFSSLSPESLFTDYYQHFSCSGFILHWNSCYCATHFLETKLTITIIISSIIITPFCCLLLIYSKKCCELQISKKSFVKKNPVHWLLEVLWLSHIHGRAL